jgi:hypothetical protein
VPSLLDLAKRLDPDALTSAQATRLGEADAGIVQIIPGVGEHSAAKQILNRCTGAV